MNAYDRHYDLSDWTFAIGLPVTESDFRRARAYGEFCTLPPAFASYQQYELEVLRHFHSHIMPLGHFGLNIIPYTSSRQYVRILTGTSPSVLYTHCGSNRYLEFSDGLIDFDPLLRKVSKNFCGIAEVCACAPLGLSNIMKKYAPEAAVVTPKIEMSVHLWMIYYSILFHQFAVAPNNYSTAAIVARKKVRSLVSESSGPTSSFC